MPRRRVAPSRPGRRVWRQADPSGGSALALVNGRAGRRRGVRAPEGLPGRQARERLAAAGLRHGPPGNRRFGAAKRHPEGWRVTGRRGTTNPESGAPPEMVPGRRRSWSRQRRPGAIGTRNGGGVFPICGALRPLSCGCVPLGRLWRRNGYPPVDRALRPFGAAQQKPLVLGPISWSEPGRLRLGRSGQPALRTLPRIGRSLMITQTFPMTEWSFEVHEWSYSFPC